MWKLTEFYNKIKAEVCNFCLGLTTIFMNGCGEMMDSVFHDLYEKYHQEIYQFIFYMTKNRETAEDLVQEVYIRVMKAYERFEGKSSEKTWMYSIARNVTIDHFRKQKGWKDKIFPNFDWDRQLLKDEEPIPEEVAIKNDEIQDIYQCLNRCTTNQRSVIILRYIQGLSITETSEVLNWSESKVKTTQHRALKAIKKLMEDLSGKEGHRIEEIPLERKRN
ncbi:ECF RNA polymerase sigma factor SigX [Peribacillus frigoritolerans]|jgi:RNA polymerase sigma-70 factor, ECF subfamily|nr:RNA polymerase sigma-70 factor (ECF subfamily) [Bacillus sp. B2I3]CAH0206312.1 ECF RNA polymerase sigma factor SigX [Peribacillus frigoritolerans]